MKKQATLAATVLPNKVLDYLKKTLSQGSGVSAGDHLLPNGGLRDRLRLISIASVRVSRTEVKEVE